MTTAVLPSLAEVQGERLSRSLVAYQREAWHVVEPHTAYIHNWHIDAITDHLEAVTRGEIRNLLINMPPRHEKSLNVSVFWPTWVWTSQAFVQWLYSSYVQALSTRDSVKCRRLIQSQWYQERWGHVFHMTGDQNVKTRYENDKNGYRIATSVGGVGTGDGADILVCLPYGEPVLTSSGWIPIGRIVEERLPVRVLSSSGRWQRIAKYESGPGRPSLRLTFAGGSSVECTDDHPIWVEDVGGFIPAREVYSLHGPVHMRYLRRGSRARPLPCSTREAGDLLFKEMLRSGGAGQDQSCVGGWRCGRQMRALRDGKDDRTGICETVPFLLAHMPRLMAAGTATPGMRAVRGVVHSPLQTEILLQDLREHGARSANAWPRQFKLPERAMGDGAWARVHESPQGESSKEGSLSLCCVWDAARHTPSSPHRPEQDEPRDGQSGHPLHLVSFSHPQEKRTGYPLGECVALEDVERIATPDRAYNLRVEPDGDYYASGILVHNCDDPHNVLEGESDKKREEVLIWWDEVMSTRLNNPQTGAKVIVMQRVHERDLSGHVLEQGGYEHLLIRAEYVPTTYVSVTGFRDPRTKQDELLWPERFPQSVIDDLKIRLGDYAYSGQCQQEPTARKGGLFERGWFEVVDEVPKPGPRVRYWDKAGTEGGGKYTVGVLEARRKDGVIFIEDVVRGQWGGPDRETQIQQTAEADAKKYGVGAVAIIMEQEPGSAGKDVIEASILNLAGHYAEGHRPTGDKFTRARPLASGAKAGNVKVLKADWTEEFLAEINKAGPGATYLDQMDAAAGAYNELTLSQGSDLSSIATALGEIAEGMERVNPYRI